MQQQDPSQQFLTFTSGSVSFWFFPQSISQATLHGRNGSNACTFIALLNAKLFHLNSNNLDLREHMTLSQAWISLFLTTITYRNNMHDKVTSGRPINFTVADAFPHLEFALRKCEIEDSFNHNMWEHSNSAELFSFLSAKTCKRKQSFVSNCDNERNEFVFCWQKWLPDCFRQLSAQPSRGHGCSEKDGQPRRTVDHIKTVTQPSVSHLQFNICFLCNSTAAHMYVRNFFSKLPVDDTTERSQNYFLIIFQEKNRVIFI